MEPPGLGASYDARPFTRTEADSGEDLESKSDGMMSTDEIRVRRNEASSARFAEDADRAIRHLNAGSGEKRTFSISLLPSAEDNRISLSHHEQYFPLRFPGGVLWIQIHDQENESKSRLLLLERSIYHSRRWLSALQNLFTQTATAPLDPAPNRSIVKREHRNTATIALVRQDEHQSNTAVRMSRPLHMSRKWHVESGPEAEESSSNEGPAAQPMGQINGSSHSEGHKEVTSQDSAGDDENVDATDKISEASSTRRE